MPQPARIQRPSISSRRIELLDSEGAVCMVATGFVVAHRGETFLVTNRHVLSGRHPDNSLVTHGARVPVSIRVTFPDVSGNGVVERGWNLYDENKQSTWLQHPSGKSVDVAALPITLPAEDHWTQPSSLDGRIPYGDQRILPRLSVGQRLFVVGFPFGADGGTRALSIWVGATIATEPSIDLHGVPRFMIDGATREGLSGAPVYVHAAGGQMAEFDDPEVDLATGMSLTPVSALIGIYSGRLYEHAQLGYVWKLNTIVEVIERGQTFNVLTDVLGD